MNLQQLEYIIALDRYKSFSKAADQCSITQATLSIMVRKLEEELGITIFDRKTSPIITTDWGKDIILEAQKILNHKEKLLRLSAELEGKTEGDLRIGVIPTIASNLLHRILPSILTKYPGLKITIHEIPTKIVIAKIKSAELDVGIVSTPLNLEDIEEHVLYYEKLLIYGNDLKNKTFRSPQDLQNEQFWLLEEGNCLTDQIIDVCSLQAKKINNNLSFRPNSFDSLINMVDNLQGLTLIPELYLQDLSIDRKKSITDFNSPYPVREVSLIFNRPYAKIKLIEKLALEIKEMIRPILATSKLRNSEMIIAKI
jgi:LysR family transcriptional regulator, hydrogen peroxide-inducible genes activator